MNLSNPLTSTFRIRPGTLLHDDKREKYFYDMILPLILVHQIWGIGVCTLAPGGPEKHSQWDINVPLAQARRWIVLTHDSLELAQRSPRVGLLG